MPSREKESAIEPIHSIFVIGESRTNADNSITKIYGSFYLAFEVDDASGAVTAFGCTHTLDLTEDFLRRLFVGQDFLAIEGWLEDALNRRYGGSSKRAVLVSYRDAVKRYRTMKGGI